MTIFRGHGKTVWPVLFRYTTVVMIAAIGFCGCGTGDKDPPKIGEDAGMDASTADVGKDPEPSARVVLSDVMVLSMTGVETDVPQNVVVEGDRIIAVGNS